MNETPAFADATGAYPHIFRELTLRHRTLRNRVVFGAHTTNMSHDGLPAEQHLAYYRERARGGAAMIVVEPMPVHPAAVLTRGNFRPGTDEVIPHFRRLAEAIQAEGAVAIQQLYHVGAHGDSDNSWHAHWSPSGGPSWHDSDGSHAMTDAEIVETIDGFIAAARRCQQAGFDGVEVWAAYHGMLDQFWTPMSNQRTDHWGGDLDGRMRMSREVLRGVREACGPDFIIGLAVNDEPDVKAALSREETAEIVGKLDAEQLIDYVTCGAGSYFDFYKLMPTFVYPENLGVDLATLLKATVQHAVVTAECHIRTPENANIVLGSGQADLVSIVRGQIADPQLVVKARQGRADDVRGCISCNQQCWGRRGRDYWISCLVNPSVGREAEWGGADPEPTTTPAHVLVVGAGPAGLEVSRVAAARGHQVTLVEAGPELGGQFRLAGLQPRRGQITDLLGWYRRQLEQLGVDVRRGLYLDGADEIAEFEADHIVLATGSQPPETGFQRALPHLAKLPGYNPKTVMSVEDVLSRGARPATQVVVLDEGGNWRGCGTAWWLAEQGHQVTVVTPDALVGKELQRTAADWPLRRVLARSGVRFITDSAIESWGTDGARVLSMLTGEVEEVPAAELVLATCNQADVSLREELLAAGITPHLIGDANAPRTAAMAFYEGRKLGLTL